jgi:hypothetical protein
MKKTMKKGNTGEIIGVLAGAVAAGFIPRLTQGINIPAPIKSAIPLVLGVFLSTNKNAMIKGAGFGMIAKGGSDLVGALIPATVSAPEDDIFMLGQDDDEDDNFLGMPANQSILSAPANQSILSGDDEFTAEEMAMMGMSEDEF